MRIPQSLLIMIFSLLLQGQALAHDFIEVDRVELVDIDPATDNGRLGWRLALADESLLVSAPFKDGQAGAVFAFDLLADGTLSFRDELQPSSTAFLLGSELAADGNWAVVAESVFSERIRIFRRTGLDWNETQIIDRADVPETAGITLRTIGTALALDGDLMAVGDRSANVEFESETVENAGAMVLFRRGLDNVWRHEMTLQSAVPVGNSDFGTAVAVSGDTVLVGAANDVVNGSTQGRAHLFQRSSGQWNAAGTLINPDADPGAGFAWTVALEEDVAIAGCATCNVNQNGPSNAGSFFSFERHLGGTGNWGLRGEFVGSQPEFIDNFSASLSLRGNVLLVGATGSKIALAFVRSANGNWQERALLQPPDAGSTRFGSSIDFAGGRVVVGADQLPDTDSSERWGAVTAWFSANVEACAGNFDAIFCDGFEIAD